MTEQKTDQVSKLSTMTEGGRNDWDDCFQSLEQRFREGQFSSLWSTLQTLYEHEIPATRKPRYYFYLLTCAVYGIGDLDRAKALNREIDFRFHPTIRYRLCLRLGDYATARRLRRAHDYNDNEQADFRYTLGLHCLWKGKYTFGFNFYQERYRAINTPKSLMAPLQYHYLTNDPADDPEVIVLEQGMGEVLISLAHIKASNRHAKSTFCGMPKYRRFVARYFPQATYRSKLDAAEFEGKSAILAVDFLKRSWQHTRSFATRELFDTPLRTRFSRPVFGICWRGGSAQNRREERHIPLQFFVEFLPKQHDYLVLQYDVTEEEKQFLRAHPNIQIPFLDLTDDALVTFDLIRELAGVIAVAGANWHLAGSANIPFLAIMHGKAHWLWGKNADARSVYPSATTLAKASLSHDKVDAWTRSALTAWQARDVLEAAPSATRVDRPIFVTGMPGTGLSRVMKQFAERGVWIGAESLRTNVDASAETIDSYSIESHENHRIRDRLLFNMLKRLGASEDGIVFPPGPERLPPFPWLRFQMEKALREQGYDGNAIWGLKDFRLVLLWPMFARAFPDATWVIVEQDAGQVGREMIASQRFSRHSTSLEYWMMFLNAFNERIALLQQSQEKVVIMKADETSSDVETIFKGIS